MIKKSINLNNIKKELEEIFKEIEYRELKALNNHQIIDLRTYKVFDTNFALDCNYYKEVINKLKGLRKDLEFLIIKVGDVVYHKEEAYNTIKKVAVARYCKNLISLIYEKIICETLKNNYRTRLCIARFNSYDLTINSEKYDNKVIMLNNKANKYDCEKLQNNDNSERRKLILDMIDNSYNNKNKYNKCMFVFISKSNNYENIVRRALDFDSSIEFLNQVSEHKTLTRYNIDCIERKVLLFCFVVD